MIRNKISHKEEWWKDAFDEKYINTYIDIVTTQKTLLEVSFLKKKLRSVSEKKVLDLACGSGRHAISLALNNYVVTGIDQSDALLQIARDRAREQGLRSNRIRFIKKDMRKFSWANEFDVILSMFTSFGYFEDGDNFQILKNVSRALKRKGSFILDVNNSLRIFTQMTTKGGLNKKTGLLTRSQKDTLSNGLRVMTKHKLDPQTMIWSMMRTWKEQNKQKSYQTNVRIYTLPELRYLLEENSLRVKKVWGDFKATEYGPDSSRMIILAEKY